MRIAIVGTGISGMVCARLLSQAHDVTVFEANRHIGGHVNTVDARQGTHGHRVDTGFIVYNQRTYPHFSKILADLRVPTQPTSMSFSVQCQRTGLEYNGTSLSGVFAQRRNMLNPRFLRMLWQILRFNRQAEQDLRQLPERLTVAEYLSQRGFGRDFAQRYLLPMGAAIWSCPLEEFSQFPIRFILEFYHNHGLLSLRDRPQWRVIRGGSSQYVDALISPFRDRIRLACPVQAIQRKPDGVQIQSAAGSETFDELVLACHADQAMRLVTDADKLECELLSAFPYSKNSVVLHTDQRVLPKERRAWASWNYHLPAQDSRRATLTYNMSMLQGLRTALPYCVTLNEDQRIAPHQHLAEFVYEHPVFKVGRAAVQARHGELIRHRRTSYCGAYWRNGFHEDGVVSALAVCQRFGMEGWSATPSSTHVRSATICPADDRSVAKLAGDTFAEQSP